MKRKVLGCLVLFGELASTVFLGALFVLERKGQPLVQTYPSAWSKLVFLLAVLALGLVEHYLLAGSGKQGGST